MIRTGWICLCLAAAFALTATEPACAGGTGAPQQTFSSSKAKAGVPVTPKQTISKKNRKAEIVFNDNGTVKTRALTNGKPSKTDKTLAKTRARTGAASTQTAQ